MHCVIKSIEEVGKVFINNSLISGLWSESTVRNAVWSGIYTYGKSTGHSPFNSGLVAEYLTGSSTNYTRRIIKGGLFGIGTAISSRVLHKLLHRK